jgi:hypothetical protein
MEVIRDSWNSLEKGLASTSFLETAKKYNLTVATIVVSNRARKDVKVTDANTSHSLTPVIYPSSPSCGTTTSSGGDSVNSGDFFSVSVSGLDDILMAFLCYSGVIPSLKIYLDVDL